MWCERPTWREMNILHDGAVFFKAAGVVVVCVILGNTAARNATKSKIMSIKQTPEHTLTHSHP